MATLLLTVCLASLGAVLGSDRPPLTIVENRDPGTWVDTIPPELSNFMNGHVPGNEYFLVERQGNGRHAIKSKKRLDREDPAVCPNFETEDDCYLELDVWYADAQKPVNLKKLQILVEDVDDNLPIFPTPVEVLQIPENSPIKSEFILTSAKDLDSSKNGILGYALLQNGRPSYTFSLRTWDRGIDEKDIRCRLVVEDVLDYEETQSYNLTLVAIGDRHNGSHTVFIQVTDTNDNQPIFDESQLKAWIPENAKIGTVVSQVFATDIDSGANGEIEFAFSQESLEESLNFFAIDKSTGEISLTRSLREQGGTKHQLMIIARDKGENPLSDVCTWTFEIEDINDYFPSISFTPYSGSCFVRPGYADGKTFFIPENQKAGTLLGYFSVEDKDKDVFGQTSLQVMTEGREFSVQESAGYYMLTQAVSFDREADGAPPDYKLQVKAWDCAGLVPTDKRCDPLETVEEFSFRIADENDNSPRFVRHDYFHDITEEQEPQINFLQVEATDSDEGENGTIIYSITGEDASIYSEYFSVSPKTGLVSMKKRLDREKLGPQFTFFIEARDSARVFPKFTTAKVRITLHDINDNPPKFDMSGHGPSEYVFKMEENVRPRTIVGKVEALDPDSHRPVTYAMEADRNIPFTVDRNSGEVRVTDQLDLERLHVKYPQYRGGFHFVVTATEDDSRERYGHSGVSRVPVKVIVLDVDEHPPEVPLENNTQFVRIPWDANEGYIITKIIANDPDNTSVLTFNISDTRPDPRFQLDPHTGVLYVSHDLLDPRRKGESCAINIHVCDSLHRAPWHVVVHLAGNWTLFNHTAATTPHMLGNFLTQVPRMVIYLTALVVLIVAILVVCWMALLVKFRKGRPRMRRPKQQPPLAYHQQEHQFNHHAGQYAGAQVSLTLQKQQQQQQQKYRKSAHEEDVDLGQDVMTPFLKTFNEMAANNKQGDATAYETTPGGGQYGTAPLRGSAAHTYQPHSPHMLAKRDLETGPHTSQARYQAQQQAAKAAAAAGGVSPLSTGPMHARGDSGASNTGGHHFQHSFDLGASGGAGNSSAPYRLTPSSMLSQPLHLQPGPYPGQHAAELGDASPPGSDNSSFDSGRGESEKEAIGGIVEIGPFRTLPGKKSRAPPMIRYADHREPDCWLPRSNSQPATSAAQTSQTLPRKLRGGQPSTPDDLPVGLRTRADEEDSPSSSAIIINPSNQILQPPSSGHEKWNLPQENSFRPTGLASTGGSGGGLNHSMSYSRPKAQELQTIEEDSSSVQDRFLPSPGMMVGNPPDLCQDVQNSLEKNFRKNSLPAKPTSQGQTSNSSKTAIV